MSLEDAMRQKTRQLLLPLESRGEARRVQRSGEASTAASGNERPGADRSYLAGWKQYFRLAEMRRVLSELDEWVRHRLRQVQLKQWKRGTTIYRELKRLGATENAARRVAANSRRWWKNSSKLLNTALPMSYYDRMGVPRLGA